MKRVDSPVAGTPVSVFIDQDAFASHQTDFCRRATGPGLVSLSHISLSHGLSSFPHPSTYPDLLALSFVQIGAIRGQPVPASSRYPTSRLPSVSTASRTVYLPRSTLRFHSCRFVRSVANQPLPRLAIPHLAFSRSVQPPAPIYLPRSTCAFIRADSCDPWPTNSFFKPICRRLTRV
jgi:hypothetical protein